MGVVTGICVKHIRPLIHSHNLEPYVDVVITKDKEKTCIGAHYPYGWIGHP
jgi:hypothetical protein